MAAVICQACDAENTADAKFCNQCGEPLAERKDQRFKTVVAVLIALVSLAGAILAWRIANIDSAAADSDVNGMVSRISWYQARVATESDMYRNLQVYLKVRIHDSLSDNLIKEAERYPSDAPENDRLWTEGWSETFIAEEYLKQISLQPEYIQPDGSYDGQAAQDLAMAERALTDDFDPTGRYFAKADQMRAKALWLTGLALILSISLLFYTLAEVIEHRIRYLFAGLGTLIFLLFFAVWPIIEWVL